MTIRKFMVAVNNKYIVAVEAMTNGGAEHVILDNITNAKTALAFDIEAGETRGDMFQNALETMQVTSLDELKEKDRAAQSRKMAAMNELLEEKNHYLHEIKELESKIAMHRHSLETVMLNIGEAEKASGIKCRRYSAREIENGQAEG